MCRAEHVICLGVGGRGQSVETVGGTPEAMLQPIIQRHINQMIENRTADRNIMQASQLNWCLWQTADLSLTTQCT